tara:strand:- start:9033 stop:9383 length:351 start_codon:yes stop_codon:yes gene_type:complete
MPQYIYEHPETEEIKEIVQSVHDEHVYSEDGVKWRRVFTVPGADIDTRINAFSAKEFSDKTANKKGSYGDFLDRSKEMANKRQEKEGRDMVQTAWFDKYSKKRKGKRHPSDPRFGQ